MEIANPWYDIAFVFMAHKEKENLFGRIMKSAIKNFSDLPGSNKEKMEYYLKSSIFYRTTYDLTFAIKHRGEKTINRVFRELNGILEDKW